MKTSYQNNVAIKNLSQEEKSEIVKQINTEVTTIAAEEERTGQKLNLPQGEQLVAIMANELMRARREISNLLPTMSKKAIYRATMAYLDLPTDDVPVFLKSDDEKKLFAFGQRAIMARMVVIQHQANKLALEARVKAEESKQQSEVQNESAT